jgi:hypothetical protein
VNYPRHRGEKSQRGVAHPGKLCDGAPRLSSSVAESTNRPEPQATGGKAIIRLLAGSQAWGYRRKSPSVDSSGKPTGLTGDASIWRKTKTPVLAGCGSTPHQAHFSQEESKMTRRGWLDLGPNLLVGAGHVLSTFIAARAAASGWVVLAGPLLLAFAVVSADGLASRLRGESSGPSWAAVLWGSAFLRAGRILTMRDPSVVKTFIPAMGTMAWATLLLHPETRRGRCRGN